MSVRGFWLNFGPLAGRRESEATASGTMLPGTAPDVGGVVRAVWRQVAGVRRSPWTGGLSPDRGTGETARRSTSARGIVGALDDGEREAEPGAGPSRRAAVSAVGPHQGDPAVEFMQSLQQRHHGIPVLDARGGGRQQAKAVHDLPFAARHLVSAVHRNCESTIAAVGVRR